MPGSDRRPEPEWPIRPGQNTDAAQRRTEAQTGADEQTIVKSRRTVISPAIIGLGAVVLLLVVLWLLTTSRNPDQDKLTGPDVASKTAPDPEKLCASPSTYELIKRDLFREAAQLRGNDQPAFDKLSAYAVLRVDNPVMESQDKATGAVNCSGSLSLDLPPGVGVVGGRRTLTSDADYTLQPAADGTGNVVLLHNADAIINPLATLARTSNPDQAQAPAAMAPTPAAPPQAAPQVAGPSPQPAPQQPAAAPPQQPAAAPPQRPQAADSSTAHPSFDCGNARTSGEVAVCRSSSLSALDRSMASQYNRAARQASPEQRRLLLGTARRFYAYRDHCPDAACIAAAYRDRMREIADIASGNWQPPR
jgi:uncharacterized protein YecT (DUF1311 family)